MGLLGRAKRWVQGGGGDEPAEVQPFRVACPEGHVIRGRRTEGYQAIRCPECGAGVFVLPRSPLPAPPMPAGRAEEAAVALADPADEAPIPLADHVPDEAVEAAEAEWLEPVEPGTVEDETAGPRYDPVDAAVSDLPGRVPAPPRRPADRDAGPRRAGREAVGAGRPRGHAAASRPAPGRILVPDRPGLGGRLRRNRPLLVGLAVLVVLAATVSWTILRNQRRDYPAMVQLGREEGIPALDRGEFDQAHRILSRAAEAVEALGGQIGGAEEVRQAAREAAIFVDLIPDRLETILDRRARTTDEAEWQSEFDRSYRGRSILVSIEMLAPADGADGPEANYRVLAVGPLQPRVARIDFDGFRLFEASPPPPDSQIQFGARLEAVEAEPSGWRIRLRPDSGVMITHFGALEALGWTPVETAALAPPARPTPHASAGPILLATLLTPPPLQDLAGETREQVLGRLGAPRSYARSASQGEFVEQWIYEGPSGSLQYINFVQSTARSGPAVVDRQFFLR